MASEGNQYAELLAVLGRWWPTVRDLPVTAQAQAYQRLLADVPERQRPAVSRCLAEVIGEDNPLFAALAHQPRMTRFRGHYYPVRTNTGGPGAADAINTPSLSAVLAFLLPLLGTLIVVGSLGSASGSGLVIGLICLAVSPLLALKGLYEGATWRASSLWAVTFGLCCLVAFFAVLALVAGWGTNLEQFP